MKSSNKFEYFPTPILEYDFRNHPQKSILMKYISDPNNSEKRTENLSISLHNEEDFLRSPTFISLRNDIQKCLDDYCVNIGISFVTFERTWFNIMEKGFSVGSHNHGGSILSGAYYPLLEENTCNLYVRNPIEKSIAFSFKPYRSNSQFSDQVIPIKQDYLYIFPSWLTHYTEPNKGNRRISISFNTQFY